MQVDSIAEQLFFTTVRIDTRNPAGVQGSGTGFFYSHVLSDKNIPFVVSNKHVVMGQAAGKLTFVQRKDNAPQLGKGFQLEIQGWNDVWFGHPDPDVDIAICPLAPLEQHIKAQNVDIFYRTVGPETVPSEEQLSKLDAIESVTFVGYPNGIWDRENLLPVARRGTTASPLHVDFENTPRFLIDASVFGGSSGSPVFIFDQGMFAVKGGGTTVGSRLFFVGVVAAVFFRTSLNQIVAVPVPTQTLPMVEQQEMVDLGIVFKARTVVETVAAFLKGKNVT